MHIPSCDNCICLACSARFLELLAIYEGDAENHCSCQGGNDSRKPLVNVINSSFHYSKVAQSRARASRVTSEVHQAERWSWGWRHRAGVGKIPYTVKETWAHRNHGAALHRVSWTRVGSFENTFRLPGGPYGVGCIPLKQFWDLVVHDGPLTLAKEPTQEASSGATRWRRGEDVDIVRFWSLLCCDGFDRVIVTGPAKWQRLHEEPWHNRPNVLKGNA